VSRLWVSGDGDVVTDPRSFVAWDAVEVGRDPSTRRPARSTPAIAADNAERRQGGRLRAVPRRRWLHHPRAELPPFASGVGVNVHRACHGVNPGVWNRFHNWLMGVGRGPKPLTSLRDRPRRWEPRSTSGPAPIATFGPQGGKRRCSGTAPRAHRGVGTAHLE
jgi:hypothetical protein